MSLVLFGTNFFTLTCSFLQCPGCVQFDNGVDLVKVSLFYKSENTSSQTIGLIKINAVALFYLIMAA